MDTNTITNWQQCFEDLLADAWQGDAAHGLGHVRRVWAAAHDMATRTPRPFDGLALMAASYLHDWVCYPKDHPRRRHAAAESAKVVTEILRVRSFPEESLVIVEDAIREHSFSARGNPQTWEGQLLQDADRLEALGAIGLARCFATGGQLQSALWHDEDPFAVARELDDKAYALDHLAVKLFRLPETMQTEPGRALARERCGFLIGFCDRLAQEMAVGDDRHGLFSLAGESGEPTTA